MIVITIGNITVITTSVAYKNISMYLLALSPDLSFLFEIDRQPSQPRLATPTPKGLDRMAVGGLGGLPPVLRPSMAPPRRL